MDKNVKLKEIREWNNRIFNSQFYKKYQNILFIYTPLKVGSTTLVSSLRLSLANSFIIIHVHNESMLEILTHYENKHKITILDIIEYNALIGKNVYVIDVYRHMIDWKLSVFFENLSDFHFNNKEENVVTFDMQKIINRFQNIYPHIEEIDYFKSKYGLENELNSLSFDFKKKYVLIQKKNIQFIKIRLQDSSSWASILTEILKHDIVIVDDYKTENKLIGELYKKMKNEYKLPMLYYEQLKKNTSFIYYNTEDEQHKYLHLWKSKLNHQLITPFTKEEFQLYEKISKENQFYHSIQQNHYLDFGCVCIACKSKRYELFLKIKNGEKTDIRINHDEAVYENKIKKQNKIIHILQTKKENTRKQTLSMSMKNKPIGMSQIIYK
jgi:hypothetical protein